MIQKESYNCWTFYFKVNLIAFSSYSLLKRIHKDVTNIYQNDKRFAALVTIWFCRTRSEAKKAFPNSPNSTSERKHNDLFSNVARIVNRRIRILSHSRGIRKRPPWNETQPYTYSLRFPSRKVAPKIPFAFEMFFHRNNNQKFTQKHHLSKNESESAQKERNRKRRQLCY